MRCLLLVAPLMSLACTGGIIDQGSRARTTACPYTSCWDGGGGDARDAVMFGVGAAIAGVLGVAAYRLAERW